jgi:hypothetical protein
MPGTNWNEHTSQNSQVRSKNDRLHCCPCIFASVARYFGERHRDGTTHPGTLPCNRESGLQCTARKPRPRQPATYDQLRVGANRGHPTRDPAGPIRDRQGRADHLAGMQAAQRSDQRTTKPPPAANGPARSGTQHNNTDTLGEVYCCLGSRIAVSEKRRTQASRAHPTATEHEESGTEPKAAGGWRYQPGTAEL